MVDMMDTSSPKKSLVIFGDSLFAQIAYEYFTHDSPYQVAGFTVGAEYLEQESFCGLPVVAFEEVHKRFPPQDYEMHIALVYMQMNAVRRRFYEAAKAKGYTLASYVSSHAFVWRNVSIGDNCFIFENNVLQPFVEIGSNIVVWSGNHIGHHSRIGNHTFIASHAVISGSVEVGEDCFIGVNATICNDLTIADGSLIGAGALIVKDTQPSKIYRGIQAQAVETRTSSASEFVRAGTRRSEDLKE